MSKCTICSKSTAGKKAKIKCNDCELVFHGSCVNLSETDIQFYEQEGEVFRCESCSKKRRASMRVESELSKNEPNIDQVLKILMDMREESKSQIQKLDAEINKSLEFHSDQMKELTNIVKAQSDSLKNFENMYQQVYEENQKLKKTVIELEQKVDDMEQYSRGNCVEINGIPEKENESVLELVKKLGTSLNFPINDEMVDTCHRVGQKTPGRTRGIIVKFTRRTVKEEILRQRRIKRNLNTKDIGFTDSNAEVIYMNESLTPHRRKIFNEARALKKEKGYTFLWVRNGKILLRESEGSRVIAVTSSAQITKLRDKKDEKSTEEEK